MIGNGGKEIFFLCLLHYNDTCKENQQFTGGERKVVKLNIQTAELALREASESNPGAWADHSRFVAEACKNIASHCKDLSSEQAYIFGLLHDIGRYAGAVRTLPGARHKSAVQNKLARRYHIIQRAG